MSETYSRPEGDELEVLLSMYEQLRQEVRAHGKRKSRRYISSLTVLGIIVGYIFTTNGDGRVLTLVPFVLAFLYMSHISSMNYVVQLAALLSLIEAKLNYPGAEYEFYHGGFNVTDNPRFENIDGGDNPDEYHNSTPKPAELQDIVQTRVRRVMGILSLVAYFGASVIGAALLSIIGIPEIGINASSVLAPTWSTVIASILLVFQTILFHQIIIAWKAYRDYKALLSNGIEPAINGDFNDGVRSMMAANSDDG